MKLNFRTLQPYARILVPFSILLILSYVPMFLSANMVELFTKEDKIYETLSAVFFFITALLYVAAYVRANRHHAESHSWLKRRSYLVLALIFIIFAGEEISWGQRIFDTGNSDLVRAINNQNETNIHNLKWLDTHRQVTGFPLSLISSGSLFLLFTLAVWLFIPVIAEAHRPAGQLFENVMPIFPWQLFLLMLLNFALFLAVKGIFKLFPELYHHPRRTSDWTITEVIEHDTALILMVIAAHLVFVTLSPSKDHPAD